MEASRLELDRLLPVLVAALAMAVALWASHPYAVGVFHDDGVYVILVAIGLGALALVRTHAIALTIALFIVLAVHRRWRTAILCAAVTGATLLPWQLWLVTHAETVGGTLSGSYGTYGAWLIVGARGGGVAFVLQTVLVNLREVAALLADHFALADGTSARNAATALALAVVVFGAYRAAKCVPMLVTFAIVYSLILLVWPFTPWRFVYAVWPVVVLFISETIAFVLAKRPVVSIRAPRIALATGVAILCIGAAREEGRAYVQRSWTRPGADATAQIAPLLRWVVARTNASDVLAVDGEQLVFLFTGRRAVPVAPFTAAEYLHPRTAEQNAESLRRLIQEVPVDYIATISPGLRSSGEMLAAATADAAVSPGTVKVTRLTPLAAGEAFRVDRMARVAP